MKGLKIGLDVDGVFANFVPTYIDTQKKVTGKELYPPHPVPIPVWEFRKHYGYTHKDIEDTNRVIGENPTWWYLLPPFEDSAFALARLHVWQTFNVHDIYFVTARHGIKVKQQTENWLKYHGMLQPTVLITDQKDKIASALGLDIYLDDSMDNINKVALHAVNTLPVLYTREWNKNLVSPFPGVIRVNNLSEFVELVSNYGESGKSA